jgi:uncharacterized protein YbaR (Trm112 family)
MFIPLVDSLRCVAAHEDTWLVASIERSEERYIRHGFLGCPICFAEYPIRDGIAYFGVDSAEGTAGAMPSGAAGEDDAIRLAAALDLTEPRMVAVLHGAWGGLAQLVRGFSPAHLLLINPPAGVASGDGLSVIRTAFIAPIARGSMDAAALGSGASPQMIDSLVASLRGGGRIAGPLDLPPPADAVELTRDDGIWVAERTEGVTSPLVSLRRAR